MNGELFANNLNEGVADLSFLDTFWEKMAYIAEFRAMHGMKNMGAFEPFIMEHFDEIFCVSEKEKEQQISKVLRENGILRIKVGKGGDLT